MTRKEFVDRIISTINEVVLPVKIKGFYEAKRWASGYNPCYGDSVLSGVIIEAAIPSLIGKPITIEKHWSYNGTYKDFSDKMIERPHYDKGEDLEGYALEYEEGEFSARKHISLKDLPGLEEDIAAYLLEKIRVAVDTRSFPGVQYAFHNHGYYSNAYCEYPAIHGEVDIEHYGAGNEPCVLFGYSFKKDLSNFKKCVHIGRPMEINGVYLYWRY